MREVRWVGQEETWGCGVAAVAMITGKTYAEVRAHVGRDLTQESGGTGGDWLELLAELGYSAARITRFQHWVQSNHRRAAWPPDPFGDVHLCEVVVSGSSIGSHMVVMLGDGSILDPLTPEAKRLSDYKDVFWVAAVIPLRWWADMPFDDHSKRLMDRTLEPDYEPSGQQVY